MVVVTSRHSTTYTADLVEWYRVVPGGPLRHQLFGRWSRPGGVITSSKDLWQRRSDLEGLQLNVVTVEVSVLFQVQSSYLVVASGLRERGGKVRVVGEKQSSEL